jgi:hypothetical protein
VSELLEMYGVSREGKYRYDLEVYIITPSRCSVSMHREPSGRAFHTVAGHTLLARPTAAVSYQGGRCQDVVMLPHVLRLQLTNLLK